MQKFGIAAVIFGKHAGKHNHRYDLCRKSLGGCDGDFWTSVDISTAINFTGNRGTDNIHDAKSFSAALLNFAQAC